MSKIIEILLKEREDILNRIEEVTAPLKAELNKADAALICLGYKFDEKQIDKASYKTSILKSKNPTIKDRVRQALKTAYPEGAHYSDILDYINHEWPHLPVKRTSLSPQLTRLRKKEIIYLDEDKGIWHLAKSKEAKTSSAPEGAEKGDETCTLI